jgi:hypothetical protein
MDPEICKAIGTLFLAIFNTLTDEHRAEIGATIARAANNPRQPDACREFYKALHDAATRPVTEEDIAASMREDMAMIRRNEFKVVS